MANYTLKQVKNHPITYTCQTVGHAFRTGPTHGTPSKSTSAHIEQSSDRNERKLFCVCSRCDHAQNCKRSSFAHHLDPNSVLLEVAHSVLRSVQLVLATAKLLHLACK